MALAAQRAGEPVARAVAQRYHVSEAMGSQLVVEARKRGHDIPKQTGGRKPAIANPSNVTPISVAGTTSAPTHGYTPDDALRLLDRG